MESAIVEAVGPWWVVWALIFAVLGVARLTVVIVWDDFPPSMAFRQWWSNVTTKHKVESWGNLFFCWWCLSPWIMAVAIGWFAASFYVVWLAWAWWIFWGWLALSYLAPIVISRDRPRDD